MRLRAADGTVEVAVRDNGAGIEPSQLESVFEMFVQLETSKSYAAGGLGLGLALVRSLVELHHGSVEARSDGPGKGCEFLVRLPRVESNEDLAPARPVLNRAAGYIS